MKMNKEQTSGKPLEEFEPETDLGRELKELAMQGLDEGVEPLEADEIMEYLGRPAYE